MDSSGNQLAPYPHRAILHIREATMPALALLALILIAVVCLSK
jgi:hypothetical protein